MYFSGLRISEAVSLQVKAIDSKRMLLRIIGKGDKESLVPFPLALLAPMRAFWKTHKHPVWLFPAVHGRRHIPASSLGVAFRMAREAANLPENITPHSLRHSFATRLIEMGVDIGVVQMLLRHSSIQSTLIYTHLTDPLRKDVQEKINELFDSFIKQGGEQ